MLTIVGWMWTTRTMIVKFRISWMPVILRRLFFTTDETPQSYNRHIYEKYTSRDEIVLFRARRLCTTQEPSRAFTTEVQRRSNVVLLQPHE